MGIPIEDLQSIASLLAAGYFRRRDQVRHAVARLDCSETSSPHGHEVNGNENRERSGDSDAKRIAWRIQALAEGDLTERARRRALEIANDADLRIRAPKVKFGADVTLDPKLSVSRKAASGLDPRLPPPGTYLEREYKGRRIIAKILEDGCEFDARFTDPSVQSPRKRRERSGTASFSSI